MTIKQYDKLRRNGFYKGLQVILYPVQIVKNGFEIKNVCEYIESLAIVTGYFTCGKKFRKAPLEQRKMAYNRLYNLCRKQVLANRKSWINTILSEDNIELETIRNMKAYIDHYNIMDIIKDCK